MARGSPQVQESEESPITGLLGKLYEGLKWPVSKVLQHAEKKEPSKPEPRLGRVVFPSGAVLRKGRGLGTQEIATLRRNEQVTILEEQGRRLLIESRTGLHGWVSSKTEAGDPIVSILQQRSSVLNEDTWEKPKRFQAGLQSSKPLPLFGSSKGTASLKAARTERAFEQAFEQRWQQISANRSNSPDRDRDRVLRPLAPQRIRSAQQVRIEKWRPGDNFGSLKYSTILDSGEASTSRSTGASSSGDIGAGVFSRSEKPPDSDVVPRLESPPGSHGSPNEQPALTSDMDLLDLHSEIPDEEPAFSRLPDPTELLSASRGDTNGLNMQWNTAPPVLGGYAKDPLIQLHGIPEAPPERRSRGVQAPSRNVSSTAPGASVPATFGASVPATFKPQNESEQDQSNSEPQFSFLEALDNIGPEEGLPETASADSKERGGDPSHAVWAADYGEIEESEAIEDFTEIDFGSDEEEAPVRPLLPDPMNLQIDDPVPETATVEVLEAGSLEALAAKAAAEFLAPSGNVATSSTSASASSIALKVSTPSEPEARADQELAQLAAAAMVNLGSNSTGGHAQTCSSSNTADAKEFKESPLGDGLAPDVGSPSDAPVDLIELS